MIVASPRRPLDADDLDALVREARSRQRRRQVGIVGGLVLLAAVAFGAYSVATGAGHNTAFARGPLSQAAAAACSGPVTPVVVSPTGLGNARAVGQILWIAVPYYGNGSPTGGSIEANKAISLSRAVLRGWRCSDGRLLRFWFYFHKTTAFTGTEQTEQLARKEEPFANHHGPVSSAALASTGTFTVTARLSGLLDGSICGGRYHHPANCVMQGYLMFSSPGKWVVQAQHGDKVMGTAVFDLHG
jgi:hypothetical protein